MTINYEDFITAKIWALLHDPPHKGLVLKDHERLSVEAAKMFLGQAIPGHVKELVRRADRFASTIERVISKYIKDLDGIYSDYVNVLNIFDTRYKAYDRDSIEKARQFSCRWFENFIRNLCKIGSKVISAPINIKYLVLYSILETAWARSEACWVSPADTRFPTHTVFDHVYTVATMVNWFIEGEEPSGYLVFFDVPGIQSLITASRRSLDYWASSMIISYLVIRTFEELIEKIGPDIFILPSMRNNPLFRIILLFHILKQDTVLDEAKALMLSYWASLEKIGDVSLVLQPVMPGTALCVLPNFREIRGLNMNFNLKSPNEVREYIINRFHNLWKDLVENILGSKDKDGIIDRGVLKDFDKIIEIVESSPFAIPRVLVMDIGYVYKEYRKRYDSTVRRVLERFKNDINNFEEACKEFLKKMFYHVLFNYIIREKMLKNSIKSENVLSFGKYISYIEDLYERHVKSSQEIDLRYCSICRRYFSLPLIKHDDVKSTRDIVLEEYKHHIKDNERLCHICLMKRLFHRKYVQPTYGYIRNSVKHIPSIHVIANESMFNMMRKISSEIKERFRENADRIILKACDLICDPTAHKLCISLIKGLLSDILMLKPCISEDLYRDYEDFLYSFEYYDYGDTLARARRTLSSIASAFMRALDEANGNVEEIKRGVRESIRSIFRIGSYPLGDSVCDSLLNRIVMRAKSYYAIIKGDGDSIGNIIFGRIFSRKPGKRDLITFEEYFRNIINNVCPESDSERRCREGLSKILCIIYELKNAIEDECSSSELDNIILTPTYHSVLSASLMITSLKDIKICGEYNCHVMYAGGDDIAALCPVETTLKVIYETRKNYQALDEPRPGPDICYFHRINNGASVIPTLTRFGRSYGVRFAHILDPMQLEIEKCTHVLENFAKKSTWINYDDYIECSKDTVAFSYGRSGEISAENICKIPLNPEWNVFEIISQLFTYTAARVLSRNLLYDIEKYLSALNNIDKKEYDKDVIETLVNVVKYIIERNVLVRDAAKDEHIRHILENINSLRRLCSIVEKIDDNKVRPLLMHVMRLVAMLITS
ncbi:MAG: type III-B CRISPR-associated protein Cas10/Cmr2, partial [Crenarchaeota archaeon]|nr:type III-B CRISPR-associated protein Cas10/Cmr2 [Thermoproteota archaeon]